MIELNERQSTLRAYAREWATELAKRAFELERSPELVHRLLDLPGMVFLARTPVPAEYDRDPILLDGHRYDGGSMERVTICEEFAAADAGMMLAAPGPSMSGVLVSQLGDKAQQEWFFSRVLERPTWTFFALTEPDRGSDAGGLQTSLVPDGDRLLLNGAKRFIGNAARASFGVVFARTKPGPLGVVAALVETSLRGFTATPFPTVGLRGNQVTDVRFDNVEITMDRMLGAHLSPTRRGLLGAVRGLNKLRPGVAALGLGIARGAYEYVRAERRDLTAWERCELDEMARDIESVRQLVRRAATAADADDPALATLASAAKARASQLAEEITLGAFGFFGAGARLQHPRLDKYARDARAVEYMEGTRNIHHLNVFQGLSRRRLAS
ncbi:acyl-CoA dehydrogenase [Nonomuraea deserti]|uniref:Acyl-CoA dehydrogenase n=1 Tax=Nonomuraea deserti TaxID=1848322 RepID=A0A4V2YCD1_9ACTN|nr:acyl-CoA dehydrogenase family protein [Nonomuraea deserti]TDD11076.1 acyl-CoA dehydrogenase [Nonomuraea deserti]